MKAADHDTRVYLITIRDTMARVSEINRLTWDDVNLKHKYVVLYTRKKRGGHLTPRKVPMTKRLYESLEARSHFQRKDVPWVFFREVRNSSTGELIVGPYKDRRNLMRVLCEKAGVRKFGFHALRHAGASHAGCPGRAHRDHSTHSGP